jgi:multidrug resistance efflux pump
MKSLNFKRKDDSHLRFILEDKTKRRSNFNWDKLIYLSILGIILFFSLRYFYFSVFYIQADGQILFEDVDISYTDDIRVEAFFVEEGDDVQKGDTLFSFLTEDIIYGGDDFVSVGSSSNWSDRETYSLKKSIDLNASKIRSDKQLLASYKSQLNRLENEIILGTSSDKELSNLTYQIKKLESVIELNLSENIILSRQLKEIQNKENSDQARDSLSNSLDKISYKYYTAPIDGYIATLYKQPYEVAIRNQVIMNLYQSNLVHVQGYFNQEDLKYIEVGDEVNVKFADGKESVGIINRFYASTIILPAEFQKKFEPIKRTIAVDVVPAPNSDISIWQRYYKMSVTLTKRTF